MAAPRLQPDDSDRVPMTPAGLALARQRAERGLRTVVVDEDGMPAFATVSTDDLERLRIDDQRFQHAREVLERISARFTEPDAAERAMEAALEFRQELRSRDEQPGK